MVAKQNIGENQGSFFDVELTGNGATDPDAYRQVAQLAANPDGTYTNGQPEVFTPPSIVDQGVMDQIHRETAMRRRSSDQAGLHSPLQRDGSYLAVRAGDKLPGREGFVRFVDAEVLEYAQILEDQRLNSYRGQ